jgi:hypothetical protein
MNVIVSYAQNFQDVCNALFLVWLLVLVLWSYRLKRHIDRMDQELWETQTRVLQVERVLRRTGFIAKKE